jgi:radical SAM protein with 4Fe4S-binding SPASM domain
MGSKVTRRKYRRQEPPFCVTPELTEGCNLYCNFCGLQGIRTKEVKNYKFMEPATLESAMSQMAQLGWTSRIEFAMRGEPSMHPDIVGMIGIAHKHRPMCHKLVISNGGGLLRKPGPVKLIIGLFEAGLNVLALDDYSDAKYVGKILEQLSAHGPLVDGQPHPLGFTFFRYPANVQGNPHIRRPRGTRMLVVIADIAKGTDHGNHGKLYNYAGVSFPPNEKMAGKRCHQPFRQLAIRYDGNVAVCCNDWRGVYRCGNVVTDGIETIWQGPALGAAREMLIQGKREFAPCKGCDHRSYRVGLLPDVLGKGKLHRPDAQTAQDIAAALADGPYTQPVLRPWEKQA